MSKTNRLSWVDSAKGISIILVVMMYSVFNVGQDADGLGLFHYVIAFATPFRMPEFFLISGLFLSQVIKRPWAHYADRRVVHYFYFYALWAVIHLVVKVGIASHAPVEAAQDIAWAVIEPYGVLWFIYLLAVFSATTKLAYTFKVPHALVLAVGAALEIGATNGVGAGGLVIGGVTINSYLVEQFANYFVFFYAGYLLAPKIFRLVDWAMDHVWQALILLFAWSALEATLVFSHGFRLAPDHVELGYAGLPFVRLALAILGGMALCVIGGLLSKLAAMDWLRWLGEHSLIVYLVFVLPMSFTRLALVKLHLAGNVTLTSLIVMVVAIGFSVALYGLVQWTGRGRFLFERPAWAHIPGTPGSRETVRPAAEAPGPIAVPAE
jgi:uncharacterized membrane protein YcfT